jgi:flavin-dependent dehydrogenase
MSGAGDHAGDKVTRVDALVVGAGLAGAACAKRLVDAGLDTVIIDKRKLPRHKICSGILSPRGHRFLIENFGPLPKEILHDPSSCRGVSFHFPSLLSLSMDFHRGPTPHLHRKHSDHWAVTSSGAAVHDETTFTGLADFGDRVEVDATHHGALVRYIARCVIGADGPGSAVTRALYPAHARSVPWFMVGQKFHEIESCPLDPDYFHFWFHPDLGHYTWSHARDGRQIVGVCFLRGDNFDRRHANVVRYLNEKHGVKLSPPSDSEAIIENFGPSVINRYVFGLGNVLLTGQAAGFLNMMAEGMSCALHSGAIAGEAVVDALRFNHAPQVVYRAMIQSEVRRCSDQWNPLRIAFANPHEADFKAALQGHALGDRLRILSEVWTFLRLYAPLGWGRQVMGQSIRRLVSGKYSDSRWI